MNFLSLIHLASISIVPSLSKLVINGGDKDSAEIKQMVSKIISAMCVFFVPMFVDLTLSLVGENSVEVGECWINANSISIAKYRAIENAKEELRKAKKAEELAKLQAENKRQENIRKEYLKKKKEEIKSNMSGSGSGGEGDCNGSYTGTKYSLTNEELIQIARMVYGEYSGDEVGMKAVASHMANLYEIRQYLGYGRGQSFFTYITTCGWYATARIRYNSNYDSAKAREVVKDVIVNGNRTLPLYIDEFDMFPGDIQGASSVSDSNNYTSGVTQIRNIYGASGTYYCITKTGYSANIFFYTANGESYKNNKGY